VNKIGPNPSHTPPENRSNNAGVVTSFRGDRKTVNSDAPSASTDTVAISNQAVDLSALESHIKQLPEIDTARVVDLHSRILAGEYNIDAESIAGKMLDLEASIDQA